MLPIEIIRCAAPMAPSALVGVGPGMGVPLGCACTHTRPDRFSAFKCTVESKVYVHPRIISAFALWHLYALMHNLPETMCTERLINKL